MAQKVHRKDHEGKRSVAKEEGDAVRVYKAMNERKYLEQLVKGRWEREKKKGRRK